MWAGRFAGGRFARFQRRGRRHLWRRRFSGGSIYVTAGTLSGAGTIKASGGSRSYAASGGGGGRIALYANTSSFSLANVSAAGGAGDQYGGAGTIYTQFGSQTVGNLIVANAGAGADTDLSQISNITTLKITGGASAFFAGSINGLLTVDGSVLAVLPGGASSGIQVAGSVSVMNGSVIRPAASPASGAASQPNLVLNVAGNLSVDAASAISATGYGYGMATGPGAGTVTSNNGGSGGGYGGNGGSYSGGGGRRGLRFDFAADRFRKRRRRGHL